MFYIFTRRECRVDIVFGFVDRLLSEAVTNFQSNQEEISLIVSPEKVRLKNYTDDEPGRNVH